jgi:hypothetical protein
VVFVDGYKGVRVDIKSHQDDFEIYDLSKDPREIHNLADTNNYFKALGQRMKDRVLQIRRPNESAPRPYDDAMVPGIAVDRFDDRVMWSVYEGNFPWVPQTVNLHPSKIGISTKVDLGVRTRDEDIAVEFKGYLKISESGQYAFTVDSDSGAIFRLHDAVVVDNESVISGARETSGNILLEKGVHPYTLTYSRRAGGKPALKFSYEKQ